MKIKQIHTARIMPILLAAILLSITETVWAGKYSYAEFKPTVSYEAKEILKKHGLPVEHDRSSPWFAISGTPGSYTIWLHKTDEIPKLAVLDIIKMSMDFYEQRGRKERFRIKMYYESKDEWRDSLFLGIGTFAGVKPYFELTIGIKE